MRVERLLPVALQRLTTIRDDDLLTEAAKRLSNTHISLVVVCNHERVMVGIITKTDVVRQMADYPGASCMMSASAVMTRDVTYCHPSDVLEDILSIMKERGFVHVPIIDQDSRPCGVLNVRDALQVLLGEVEYDRSFTRDYIMGIGYH